MHWGLRNNHGEHLIDFAYNGRSEIAFWMTEAAGP